MKISKFNTEKIDDKISVYEDVIGAALPDQFKVFLKKYNGGETPNTSFCCSGVSSDIKGFYGLGNVKYPLDKLKPIVRGEKQYLPIALDSFGNDVVMDILTGKINFWDHETGEIVLISVDLRSFISICESKPVSKGAVKSVEEREKELVEKGRGSVITEALRDMWRAEIAKYTAMNLENVVI